MRVTTGLLLTAALLGPGAAQARLGGQQFGGQIVGGQIVGGQRFGGQIGGQFGGQFVGGQFGGQFVGGQIGDQIGDKRLERFNPQLNPQLLPPNISIPKFSPLRATKPTEPFHWENVPWGMLLTIGAVILVGSIAAGFYKAKRPG
jgi:hypothetical protein